MNKQEEIITQALTSVLDNGGKICKGIIYDATQPNTYGVDGAILVWAGKSEWLTKRGWVKEICQTLEVDSFWLRRFWLGFDRGYHCLIEVNDCFSEITRYKSDEVSKLGIRLAKEYCNG